MSLLHKITKAATVGYRSALRVLRAPSYEELVTSERLAMRTRTLQKATNMVSQSSKRYYMTEQDEVEALEYRARQLNNDPMRRAIYSVNSYLNIFGIPRANFWKSDNDRLARNAIYAVCEKRIMDTIETAEWEVTNNNKVPVEFAEKFLKRPNPQDTFQTLIKQTIPDILRYDQAAWVKVRSIAGNLLELKAYSGPEFWIEVDNQFGNVMGQYGLNYFGPWSHGYVKRYWQHSRPGVYIPFAPTDVCMIMMYKRADSIYGTDFIQQLKWQLEYMIDSTKAAGMTFANGIGPSLVWKHPDLSSIEQLEERNMEVELENKGPENFGNILHLLGQEEISTVFPELMHMQWLEGQKFISSIIWAMFGFSESEFTSGDANRATAYINQNITKSKMLAPILRHLETVINTEILPELDGYQADWEFRFKPIVELDDLLKEIQVEQGRADVVSKWINAGVPLEEAMRMAKVDEDHIKAVTEAVDRVSQQDNQSMETALQNLKQADITQELAGDAGNTGNQPDQGGKPHSEGYSGQARSDSGEPEDDGQKKNPFGKADFKESEHPRADDGQFGDKPGEQSGKQEESKPAGDAGKTPVKPEIPTPDKVTARFKTYEPYIKNNKTESAKVFDKDGETILIKGGNIDSIEFTEDEIKSLKDGYFTHNHPSGGSFSPADYFMAMKIDLAQIRCVSSKYLHILDRGNGWIDQETILPIINNKMKEVEGENWDKIFNGKITPEEASLNHWHEIWSRVAQETGILYHREEL